MILFDKCSVVEIHYISMLDIATTHYVLSAFKSVLLERNAKEQHARV